MIGSQYIPIINADNFNIPLIYDAQEIVGTTTTLSFFKDLISRDSSFQDSEYCSTKTLNGVEESSFDMIFFNSKNIQLLKHFELGTLQTISFSKLTELTDFESLSLDMKLDKKINFKEESSQQTSYILSEFISHFDSSIFDYIFYSQKTLDLIPIFSLTSSQTLSLSKILELSKSFTISGAIETLSISKIINLGNEIQLDYLYNLIEYSLIDDSNFKFDYQTDLLLSQILEDSYTISYISPVSPIKLFAITGKKIAMEITGKKIAMDIAANEFN